MINPQPGATIYEQLAAELRHQITAGTLRPGHVIPSERTLAQQHGIGRQTAAHAIQLLRSEGLLEYRRGKGVFVREQNPLTDLTPPAGSVGIIRMPTAAERSELGIRDGVPVLEVTHPDGNSTLYSADQWRLRWQ